MPELTNTAPASSRALQPESLKLAINRANNLARRPAGVPTRRFEKVGVLGAGLMGAGIACVCARAGMQVVMLDVDEATAGSSLDRMRKQEDAAVAKGKADRETADAWLSRITPSGRYEDLHDVDIVVEAVFEDRGIKAEATRRAEAVIPSHALFATNTSTLPIGGLAQASARPQQFVGLHFFSPVPRMPLLEVIRGSETTDRTLAESLDFARAIAKTPIVVNDHRGFYTTRVIMRYDAEAYEMLIEGVDPARIEEAGAMSGMPMPPLALADAVALDLVHRIYSQTRRDTQNAGPLTAVEKLITSMVEQHGRFGKKNDKGFYDYGGEYPGGKRLWPGLASVAGPLTHEQPSLEEIRDRLLGVQALEAARCLVEGVINDPSECDVGAVLGWNFAPSTGGPVAYIDGLGVKAFVAQCDSFAKKLGERFAVPPALRRLADQGETVLGHNWDAR